MSPSARERKKREPSGAAGGLPFLLFILDSHEKQAESAFHGASARRSLKETASAPRAQKGDAFSGTLPRKSACFFLIASEWQDGNDLIPVHLAGLPETEAPAEGPGGGILRRIGEPAALRPPTGVGYRPGPPPGQLFPGPGPGIAGQSSAAGCSSCPGPGPAHLHRRWSRSRS